MSRALKWLLTTGCAGGLLSCASVAFAQTAEPALQPPGNVHAKDHPWDGGEMIDLTWTLSPDDPPKVLTYRVFWQHAPEAIAELEQEIADRLAELQRRLQAKPQSTYFRDEIEKSKKRLKEVRANAPSAAGSVAAGISAFTVENLEPGRAYLFQVVAVGKTDEQSPPAETTEALRPAMQFFSGDRLWVLIIELVICASVVIFIVLARRGYPLKIRKIPGLEAVQEAVGRATEMGRPVLFVPGIQDMNDIQTIAGVTVLGSVARTAAEYDARIEVPTDRSLVMTACRETVQSAFYAAGRPDAFNPEKIYYVTDEQFGYVAYLTGYMVREKPAACFYMGAFFAESLILAETGNSIGAIQIAGTANPEQLPFFVAACDYTLIGEEFFAASAYLSGEPDQLGSLKGQDVGKMIVACGLIIGCVIATFASIDRDKNSNWNRSLTFLQDVMLK